MAGTIGSIHVYGNWKKSAQAFITEWYLALSYQFIGSHPIPGLPRNGRRSSDETGLIEFAELTIDPIAPGVSFIVKRRGSHLGRRIE